MQGASLQPHGRGQRLALKSQSAHGSDCLGWLHHGVGAALHSCLTARHSRRYGTVEPRCLCLCNQDHALTLAGPQILLQALHLLTEAQRLGMGLCLPAPKLAQLVLEAVSLREHCLQFLMHKLGVLQLCLELGQ